MAASPTYPVVEAAAPSRVSWLLRVLFSFPAMLIAGLTFLTVWGCVSRFDDPDLWWHLRLGQTIWESGVIPSADQFSFTAPGHAWVAHEWLSQVMLYGVYLAGGPTALMLWLCGVASVIVALTYVLCSLWSGNWKVSLFGALLAMFQLTISLAIRPLLLGHLFLVVELLLLYAGLMRHSRWVWALPVLFAVWVNCHGSFLFGLGVAGGAMLSRFITFDGWRPNFQFRRSELSWVWLVAACFAALFVNPIGLDLILSPLNVMFSQPDNINNVQEWAPLLITDPRALVLLATIGVIAVLAMRDARRLPVPVWLLFALVVFMAVQHSRMLPLFGFVSAPLLCWLLAPHWDNYNPRRDFPLINACLMAIAALACYAMLPTPAELQKQVDAKEPIAALRAIDTQHLSGPMLNEYVWGGYLLWARPQEPVFIDGRTDIYAWTGVLREYGKWAMLQDDPQKLLDRYQIRTCLLASTAPMAQVMRHLPGWHLAYSDPMAVVFTRSL